MRVRIVAALLYVVLAWGLNTVLVKLVFADIDPLALMAMRFIAMPPLAVLMLRLAGEPLRFERRDFPQLVLCAACGFGVYQYFWMVGLAHTTAFASALLGSLAPVFTLALIALMRHDRVRGLRWAGAATALLGVAIFEGAFAGRATVRLGDALTLVAAAIFAGYNVLSARLLRRYSPMRLVTVTMCLAAVMIVPGGVWAMLHTPYARLPWSFWIVFVYSVLFPILLTYPVWTWAIREIGPARVSLFSYFVPIAAGMLSVPILSARITPYEVGGCVVCIGGMIVATTLGSGRLEARRDIDGVPIAPPLLVDE